MSTETQCPYCGMRFRVQDEYLRRAARCKQCGERFVLWPRSPASEAEFPEDYVGGFEAIHAALEARLGPTDGKVYSGMPPLRLGGPADVLTFPAYPPGGIAYVTCGLICVDGQRTGVLGRYELMACSRVPEPRLAPVLANLGRHTHEALFEPGHTIDFGPHQPPGCTLRGGLFLRPDVPADPFRLFKQRCGLLLLVGITEREMDAARDEERQPEVIRRLREAGVIPYTLFERESVV